MRRLTQVMPLLALALILAASPVIARDEIQFAEALADQGYFELAQEVCESIRDHRRTSVHDQAAVELVAIRILQAHAEAEPDCDRKSLLYDHAVRSCEKFVAGHPTHALALVAGLRIAELRHAQGALLVERIEREPDAARRAPLVAGADRLFQECSARLQELARSCAGPPPREPEHMQARYLACVGACLHAGIFVDDAKHRSELARQAIALIDDMQWNYPEDLVFLFDLWIYKGLAWQFLGDAAQALDAFVRAGALLDQVSPAEAANPYVVRIVSRARSLAAHSANEQNKHQVSIDLVDGLFRKLPSLMADPAGVACRLEKARALAALGRGNEAVRELEPIVAAGDRRAGEAATLLAECHDASGTTPSPNALLALADVKLAAEDWPAAAEYARRAAASAPPAEEAKLVPPALYRLGLAHAGMERLREAADAFRELARRFPAHPLAPRAAFEAAKCLSRIAGAGGDPGDRQRYDEAIRFLSATFPDSREARNVQFLVAQRLEDNARSDPADLLRAADEYAKVAPEAGELYEIALTRAGFCAYLHGRRLWSRSPEAPQTNAKEVSDSFERAARSFDAFLAHIRIGPAADPERARQRLALRYGCLDCLAHIALHPAVAAPARVHELFRDAEEAFRDTPENVAKSLVLCLQADLALGDAAAAEERFARLCERFPSSRPLPGAARDLALALESLAGRASAEPPRASELRRKAAHYLSLWLTESARLGLDVPRADRSAVGERIFRLAREEKSPELFRAAADLFRQIKAGNAAPGPDDWQLDWNIAECLLALEDWQACLPLYERLRTEKPDMALLLQQLAQVYAGLAAAGDAGYRKKAFDLAASLLARTEKASEPWWKSQAIVARFLFAAGNYQELAAKLRTLRLAYPDYDGNRFGAKDAMTALERELADKGIEVARLK